MMFDEQYGWVELGTPGVHSGAVVQDVAREVAALDRIHARPAYDLEAATRRMDDVRVWGGLARAITSEVSHALNIPPRYVFGADVAREGDRTTVTTCRMDGDALRIVHTAMLPTPQMVNVTLNLTADGGES